MNKQAGCSSMLFPKSRMKSEEEVEVNISIQYIQQFKKHPWE